MDSSGPLPLLASVLDSKETRPRLRMQTPLGSGKRPVGQSQLPVPDSLGRVGNG